MAPRPPSPSGSGGNPTGIASGISSGLRPQSGVSGHHSRPSSGSRRPGDGDWGLPPRSPRSARHSPVSRTRGESQSAVLGELRPAEDGGSIAGWGSGGVSLTGSELAGGVDQFPAPHAELSVVQEVSSEQQV